MKVLWITHYILPEAAKALGKPSINIEGWLVGLLEQLRITNLSMHTLCLADVPQIFHFEINGVVHHILPQTTTNVTEIRAILDNLNPDVIHLNGTEYRLGLEVLKQLDFTNRCVISLQGVMNGIKRYFFTGIDVDYLAHHPVFALWNYHVYRHNFCQRADQELKFFQIGRHFIGRTDWDHFHTKVLSPGSNYYSCNETLRPSFYKCEPWSLERVQRHKLFVCQAHYSIKGFHILLKAVLQLREEFNIQVHVAGVDMVNKKSRFPIAYTYGDYLRHLIVEYNLADCIHFVGSLNEQQMLKEYQTSHVCVIPSTIENSPNSLGEAQIVGCPVVAANVGGISWLTSGGKTALLYRCEEWEFAYQYIKNIFLSDDLAKRLSKLGRIRAEELHNPEKNCREMLNIYEKVAGYYEKG